MLQRIGAALPVVACVHSPRAVAVGNQQTLGLPFWRGAVNDLGAAASIGRACQHLVPPLDTASVRVLAAVEHHRKFARDNEQLARQVVARLIKTDYLSGNDLSFDGWLLSRTECELCVYLFEHRNR